MTIKIKHWLFEHHLAATGLAVVTAFVLWATVGSLRNIEFLGGALASAFGFLYFIAKQHFDETQLFKQLFTDFNARYDKLNADLHRIAAGAHNTALTQEEMFLLYDYFNLCAEEYLYFKKGFVFPEVWTAWVNGMRVFASSPRIRALWKEELKNNSFYGFQMPLCEECPLSAHKY
jgi:hypothetical protein